ncbi:MAG: RNA polymerase sigma factor [Vicinamibacterales bacterium]
MSRFPGCSVMTEVDRDYELDLVARLRAGDPSAFDVVHECYNKRLFNFLARLARRREVAEDLLEETWLRLVSRVSTLRNDTRLGPWLFTVARNLYVSYRRSRLVEDSYASGFIGLWPCGVVGRSPFEMAASTETERRIESALAALPVIYREAVLLTVEGLSSADAAQVCGISPEAMRQRLRRGRALLVRSLDDNDVPFIAALRQVKA